MFDSTTLAAYLAAGTPQAKAEAVRDSIGSGTLSAVISDSGTPVYTGTFPGPLIASGGVLSADSKLAGLYPDPAVPDGATWTLRIQNAGGTRWVEGTFGSGGRFTVSRDLAKGQALRLDVAIGAPGAVASGSLAATDVADTFAAAGTGSDPLTVATIPSLTINQGGTLDLSQYVTGGVPPYTYDLEAGTLPTGVTLDAATGVLSATASATLTTATGLQLGVNDSAGVAGSLPTFMVTSAVGGTSLPFTFGHVFAQGDVPTGRYVDSDLADWQVVPTTYWPDGSLRHAIIAGRVTGNGGVPVAIQLSTSATNRTGTALTTTDLAAAMPTINLVCGASSAGLTGETISLNTLIGTAPHRTVCTGPIMSNWIWREPIGNSSHLVAWFDVRCYKGNRVEVFPWIENAYLTVASPTNDVRTYTLTRDGDTWFSATLDIKHHTRIPLLTGTTFSYWNNDPQITPTHDVAYLMASKMVPKYGWTTNGTTLSSLTQTYTPNWVGIGSTAMTDTGFQSRIGVIPNWNAAFLSSSGDARAYRSTIANGLASGSWSIHYRDNATNEPLKFGSYPNTSINGWGGSPSIPNGGTGGSNGSHDTAHQPTYTYLPWLLTGRWWFLDELLFWTTHNYLWESYVVREGASGLFWGEQVRSSAWELRTLAQAFACLPSGHTCYADIKTSWEANTLAYQQRFVTGTRNGGAWVNTLGVQGLFALYNSGAGGYWWEAPWQQSFLHLAWAHAWDLGLNQSTASRASHQAIRDHGYKHAVGLAGDSSAYCFRNFGSFSLPYGSDASGLPPENWLTWPQVLTALRANSTWPTLTCTAGETIYTTSSSPRALIAGDWGTESAVCASYAALAMAREHGADGAADAWSRITGSSSWSLAPADFQATPVWSIYPRNV